MSMLNIGVSGLGAAQQVLKVASQNIANANVAGYSRQALQLTSRSGNGGLDAGAGVEVGSLRRVADSFLTSQLWQASAAKGFHTSFQQQIDFAEQLLGTDSLSLASGLDGFFAALEAASADPSAIAPRQQILSAAADLSQRFNQLAGSLNEQLQQLDEQAGAMLEQVNGLSRQIAELNRALVAGGSSGGNSTQLEDRRDQAVRELSALVAVKVSREPDNSLSLNLVRGQPLVLGASAGQLTGSLGEARLRLGNHSFPLGSEPGGALGGLQAYRHSVLEPTLQSLNGQARQLAEQVNAALASGVDVNAPQQAGQPLFSLEAANPAASLGLVAGRQPRDLALAATGGGIGDNRNLLALLTLREPLSADYDGLLGSLASRAAQAKAELSASEQLESSLQAKRDAASGVNLDEEAANLMAYTQAYQANAKVISAADELFQTLMGIV